MRNGFNKILMTTDNLGGVWTYSLELLSQLENNGFVTALAVMGAKLSSEQRKQISVFKNVEVYESEYKLEWMEDPWEDIDLAGEWLLSIRNKFQPELIHLNNFSFGALKWGLPVVTVAHSDVISWWYNVLNRPIPKRLNEYLMRVKFGLQDSNYIVTPSATMLKYINQIYGTFRNQRVIYNGRSTDQFYRSEKEKMIFSMGRIWDTAKNISLLINSAPMLKWKVTLAGNIQNPVTEEVTLHGNIEFLGSLPPAGITEYLSKASIFVLPAKYEPFGLSPLEAALSGCALVLGKIESLQEIWEDNALYVDTDSPDMLVETVNELTCNENLRKNYAEKAYNRALEFTTTRMFNEYMDVYRSVLNPHDYFIHK
jgi:glycogen synthase